ncbi:sarcosine oxidase subunit alpha family protein [Pseudooceanicola sp.]|uniref:sarcosine oxidase subunit alpha family protein n=1 Tax=Pseudooceanicola sp. TaxID=1914328 RepID=UPI0035C72827
MSTRLTTGGQRIDRTAPVTFTFNGQSLKGYRGDTLASALLANDRMMLGRSFKYHRPRGLVASGTEEPNALLGIGEGGRFEPNQRATMQEIYEGLTAGSQNHWPSLEFDVGEINAYLSRFFPAGFYYKTFMWPRSFWKHVFEPVIRQSAGLGKAPKDRDADTYEHYYHFCDVLVIGGGLSGLVAARAAASGGARVTLLEQEAQFGGRTGTDDPEVGAATAQALVDELSGMENVTLVTRCMGAGVYDHGYVLGYERLTDHQAAKDGPRHRLWRIRAGQVITATGAIERPLSFAGNDVPGVMLASAVRDYLVAYGVSVGDRTVVVTNNDDAYLTAIRLAEAGLSVPVIVDARANGAGELGARAEGLGIRVLKGHGVAKVKGRKRVTGVALCKQVGEGAVVEEIACDAVAMSGGWSPVVHLWSHCGGKLIWDEDQAMFRPDADRPPTGGQGEGFVRVAGVANGVLALDALLADAAAQGLAAAEAVGQVGQPVDLPEVPARADNAIEPVWLMPASAKRTLRAKTWLDYQNDVKVTDIQLAAQEGYESVEHAKRYTTLGMATDQGKLSNINGLAILSGALDSPIPQVGTTTFRPPYTPISMGSIAGEARAETFQPLRRSPLHDWHEANGADWEPVGPWRRPFTYLRTGETRAQAVEREILQTRDSLGLLDASTLGKLIVKGPDAGRFMDMMYTNMMSNLKPGKCRYGLMCSENGFLMDDGVVARWDEDTWLCHTTTGGADRIHAHMEEWLQTEWWDWNVWVVNATEQYAQIGVVGPQARRVLEKLGAEGIGNEDFPFMTFQDHRLAGIEARVYRISFSGELSYEIAVTAGQGRALWDALMEAGAEFDVMPYGTEALHVLRAEKGFIMIGDETDGTVIPQDLGLTWAISKKKEDFIGKRAQQREDMARPDRWKLVGLQTLDGSVLPDGAYAVAAGVNANGQRNVEGRVTSTYRSPTLQRGIAMGLVLNGPNRMGETLQFNRVDGSTIPTRIVDPVFYDKEGTKNV